MEKLQKQIDADTTRFDAFVEFKQAVDTSPHFDQLDRKRVDAELERMQQALALLKARHARMVTYNGDIVQLSKDISARGRLLRTFEHTVDFTANGPHQTLAQHFVEKQCDLQRLRQNFRYAIEHGITKGP